MAMWALAITAAVGTAASIASQTMKKGTPPGGTGGPTGSGENKVSVPDVFGGKEAGGAENKPAPASLAQALGAGGNAASFGPQGQQADLMQQMLQEKRMKGLLGG